MDQTLDELTQRIDQFGWTVVNAEGENNEPLFAYSVGLYHSYRHPEIIVFGLRDDVLRDVINTIGGEVRDGHRFEPDSASDRVLTGYTCAFRAVAPGAFRHYMGLAAQYYDADVPALHCIWPDRDGHFPWDSLAASTYRRLQPMLSEGPEPFSTQRP